MNIKDLLFNKKFGRKYMVINFILTLFPVLFSLITKSLSWMVSLSLFIVYASSYCLASISYEQNKKIGQLIDPDIVLKAFSFVFGVLATLLYVLINFFIQIPLEIVYIFANAIISLFVLYAKIFDKETTNIKDKKGKVRTIFNTIWDSLPKSFFLRVIFIILVIILFVFTIGIYFFYYINKLPVTLFLD
ncbi:MAG TPA: hypothetical protein GX396_11085 [Tissierellia bacterium]|uniref:Uncharacterized protein n=1 Tax=Tissierella carlieri TaxID=689904 RepID=A0ABT1S716_9FIRM|nr:hypothetical protein [Tissierella carlieri]MCQ4922272.1 hypothetical protein [Tissierella carlieri]HHZ03456.1 hypothetical protein [Tissierellia bacterium]